MLRRKRARVSMALYYAGGGLVLLNWLYEMLGDTHSSGTGLLYWPGVTLLLAGLLLWRFTVRCPHCGKRGGLPCRWSYQKREYCPHCGRVLLYDDMPSHDEGAPLSQRERFLLKRGWVWLGLALMAVGSACIAGALGIALFWEPRFQGLGPADMDVAGLWRVQDIRIRLGVTGIITLASGLFLARRLRCPGCGKGSAVFWQRRGEARWCWHCGAALAFEDELEYEQI